MPAKSKEFTYATVCSGIECMSAAVAPLGGWKPVFFSEIEPFPCSLLKHRYPTVPNLGDMTKITAEKVGEEKWRITNGTDVIELAGRLGCLAGGTPCQDVSVAGKRAGMAEGSGTRSSLAFHFARLCRELQPRWVLWENVPGVLTSNGGRDFAHFVRSIGECGYSLAYRTLDAQWVRVDGLPRAVPQRRRRVWLVGHLGDCWRTPAEVLFEPQGMRGDSPPRRIAGQGFTRETGGGAEGADRPVPTNSNGGDVMPALTARDLEARMTGQADRSGGYVMQPSGFDPYEPGGVKSDSPEVSGALVNGSSPGFHNAVCFENHQTDARTQEVDVAPTMGATHNAQAANNNPLVVAIDMDKNKPTNADKPVRKGGAGFGVSEKGASYTLTARDQHAVAYAIDSMGSNAMKSKNPKSGCREVECAPTLTTVDSAPVKHQGGTAVVAFLPGNSRKARSIAADEEVSPTLMRTQGESGNKVAVATECVGVFDMEAGKSGARTDTSGVSPTILALHGTDPHAVCIGFNCEAGTHDHKPKDNLGETLAVSHKCGVAIGLDRASFNQGKNAKFGFSVEEECAPTVVSKGPGAVSFEPGIAKREGAPHRFSDEVTSTLRSDMGDNLPAVAVDYIVRRLTPLECERLQGLPDGYTLIPHRGKPAEECPDTPRYKALGNGWAVNCARWICQRIQKHEQDNTHGNE
ncbi:MAG: DNA cytosine methyltransferase [Kiritimatiellae bacterium]|nr:DNA cytosine methyltransferase [Kiritimatiellia bacterium]